MRPWSARASAAGTRSSVYSRTTLQSGSTVPSQYGPCRAARVEPEAISMALATGWPQAGEGASSTSPATRARAAASCATSPPMEWPTSTGGSAQRRTASTTVAV